MKDTSNYLSQRITGFDLIPNQVLHQKLREKFNNHKNALVKSQKDNQATNGEQVINNIAAGGPAAGQDADAQNIQPNVTAT